MLRKIREFESSHIMVWFYTICVSVCFALLGTTLSAKAIWDFLGSEVAIEISKLALPSFLFLIYLALTWRLYQTGRRVFPKIKETRLRKQDNSACVLIYNLSTLPPHIKLEKVDDQYCLRMPSTNLMIPLSGELSQDLQTLSAYETKGVQWNWTQVLRAINEHKATIQRVYLVVTGDFVRASKQNIGSHSVSELAKMWLESYSILNNVDIEVHGVRLHPEKVKESAEAYSDLIDMIKTEYLYKESEITLDITGGLSTMSVAGALATLDKKVTFQYVSTDGEGRVTQFAINLESPETKRL